MPTVRAEIERLRAALDDLAEGREHVQCLVAQVGEQTAECPIRTPCAACRAASRIAMLRGVPKFTER